MKNIDEISQQAMLIVVYLKAIKEVFHTLELMQKEYMR